MARRTHRHMRTSRRMVSHSNAMRSHTGLSAYALGNALGIVGVVCLLFYAVISWISGYDASVIVAQFPLYFSIVDWTLLIGLIQIYVMGYIGGWIFAKVYNRSLRR